MSDCFCEKDTDGECPPCRTGIQAAAQEITEVNLRASADLSRCVEKLQALCDGCGDKYLDFAISKVILGFVESGLVGGFGRPLTLAMVLQWREMLKARGITAAPLIMKVWEEICAKEGWDPTL